MTAHRTSPFDWLIAETLVMSIIGLNALVLFLDGFPSVSETTGGLLGWVDYACLLYFIVEAFIKLNKATFSGYWEQGWNKLDFIIVAISSPLFLEPFVGGSVGFFSIVMVGRFLRFLRIMRFVPNGPKIWAGVVRALKASMASVPDTFCAQSYFCLGCKHPIWGYFSRTFWRSIAFCVFPVQGFHR